MTRISILMVPFVASLFLVGCGEDDATVQVCIPRNADTGLCDSRETAKPALTNYSQGQASSRNCDEADVESVNSDAVEQSGSDTPCCYNVTLSFSGCSAFGKLRVKKRNQAIASFCGNSQVESTKSGVYLRAFSTACLAPRLRFVRLRL